MPDSPVEVDHVTCATPTLSWAAPLTTIELAEVATVVIAGERMVKEGGAVSPPEPGFAGGFAGVGAGGFAGGGAGGLPEIGLPTVGGWLVTVTVCDTWFCLESLAVTVMTFRPAPKGIAAVDHAGEPTAVPAAPTAVPA